MLKDILGTNSKRQMQSEKSTIIKKGYSEERNMLHKDIKKQRDIRNVTNGKHSRLMRRQQGDNITSYCSLTLGATSEYTKTLMHFKCHGTSVERHRCNESTLYPTQQLVIQTSDFQNTTRNMSTRRKQNGLL